MSDYDCSKTDIGVILCLCLSFIGLIVGLCMYPSGTYARSSFVRGWVTAFIVTTIIALIICFFVFMFITTIF